MAFTVRSSVRNRYLGFLTVMNGFTDLEYRYQQTLTEVANLETEVQYLRENAGGGGDGGGGGGVGTQGRATGMQSFAQFALNTVIRPEYLRYIQRYGVPEDGIFLPTLLSTVT